MSELLDYGIEPYTLRDVLGRCLSAVVSWKGSVKNLLSQGGDREREVFRVTADKLNISFDQVLDRKTRLTYADYLQDQLSALVMGEGGPDDLDLLAEVSGLPTYHFWSVARDRIGINLPLQGLSEGDYKAVLESPSSVQQISLVNNDQLTIFVKTLDDPGDEIAWRFVFVGTFAGEHTAMGAYMIYASELEIDPEVASPLDLLRDFTRVCGKRVRLDSGWEGEFYADLKPLLVKDVDLISDAATGQRLQLLQEVGEKSSTQIVAMRSFDLIRGAAGFIFLIAISMSKYHEMLHRHGLDIRSLSQKDVTQSPGLE